MIDESADICFRHRWQRKSEVDGGEIGEHRKSGQDPTAVGFSGSNERLDIHVDYGDVGKDLSDCGARLKRKSADDSGDEEEDVSEVNYDCEPRTIGNLIAGLEIVE